MEISAARLAHNLRVVQQSVGAEVDVLAVVKANGYGHGVEVVAPALVAGGAKWLGVTDLEEGLLVRGLVPATRILVMCGMERGDAEGVVANDLTQVIWTAEHVRALDAAAKAVGREAVVHLEVDTGMGRQGAAVGAELETALEALQAAEFVKLEGLMTHFCESEVAGSAVTALQLEKFERATAQVVAAGMTPKLLHVGNSSAVDEGSSMAWVREHAQAMGARTMVRPGLAVYGHCLPLEHASSAGRVVNALQPALTWKTHVIGVREVVAGETVGYGATFTATQPMKLALIPVGYADGFRRAASSGVGDGWVVIAGQRTRVVGRVSMNLTVVDVTSLSEVAVGDVATVLGEGVSAEDHAEWAGTISYDILCGIRARFVLV